MQPMSAVNTDLALGASQLSVPSQPNGFAVSAIIPVWNEALWLPSLIQRLSAERCISEIIIADNSSDDNSVEIALAAGCKVVQGGLPAAGRNAGAQEAKDDILLFVDADVAITPAVFAAAFREFMNPACMLVHFPLSPITSRRFVKVCYWLVNLYADLCSRLRIHQGSAPLIYVRRAAFAVVGGFDETVHATEDAEFIRRLSRRLGGVAYVRTTPVYVSSRRFELEPTARYIVKCITAVILRFLGLSVRLCRNNWITYPSDIARRDGVNLDLS
jgi:glycosyltransferase involved in cell wall biosynthesis